MNNPPWFLIESENEYDKAIARYQEVKYSQKGSEEYKEKRLLVLLITEFEKATISFPEVDPIEIIKVRMDDLGLKASDLAKVYGDKGTISKVLNYKQALSITMIRKFSDLLQLPAKALLKEYELKTHKEYASEVPKKSGN